MQAKSAGIQSYGLMLIATVIAVSIVTSSQLVTQRIGLLMDRQASELLAADLVVVSSNQLPESYQQTATDFNLTSSRTISLRSAIFIDDSPQLIELKAVDDLYPLRGELEITRDIIGSREKTKTGPARGEVWLDPKLASHLDKPVTLGTTSFKSSWLLSYEPDRGGTLFSIAPRILMNIDDLSTTGLIIPGSRASYRILFSGEQSNIAEFKNWLENRLSEGESLQDLDNARPEMRRALDRTRMFFALSIVLTLIIAMVAIAITARYTANREAPKVAILRAFGVSQFNLFKYYIRLIGKLWIIATLIGLLLGWLIQFPLEWALDGWFGKDLPRVITLRPFLVASIVGLISLAGFCLPHLISVTATAPMQVLRSGQDSRSRRRELWITGVAIATVFLVLVVLVQNSKIAIATLGLILVVGIFLPIVFRFLINAFLYSSKRRFWLKQYLLSRLKSASRGALYVMSGFTLALVAILMIAVVKDELLSSWQSQLPTGTPNYFMINLPTDDVPEIKQFLDQRNITSSTAYPLVRARIDRINNVDVEQIDFTDPRAKHQLNHTFNISYAQQLPVGNDITAGVWNSDALNATQLSIEQGVANRLQLKLGDRLTMSVGADIIEAPVTSIRSVVWENFRPNFYLIANRALIQDLPQTWLLSATIDSAQKKDLKQLLERFPSITLLDITELMARIQGIVNRATVALQFFFIFALAAALIVLLAAIQTGKRERQLESSLLRALAATTGQLYRVHVLEFTLMGLLIGFFAALVATLGGWLISTYFFDMEYHFSSSVWFYSLFSATLVLTIAGVLVSRKVYNISPMKALRS